MLTLTLGEEVIEYLNTKNQSTRVTYSAGLTWFLKYYQSQYGSTSTLSDFLDRLDTNLQLPRRQKQHLAEQEVNKFFDFLIQQRRSRNTIRTYFAAIQNFLKYKGFELSGNFVKLPASTPDIDNQKHAWALDEVRSFVAVANSMRDKAIILCLFQSGMGVGELCRLNYGDIKDELETSILPLCLSITRQKTWVTYKTFFGYDAIRYLSLYLETRRRLRRESALFTKLGSNSERVTLAAIQAKLRECTKQVSFLKDHELKGYNPCRPHSLRSAFRSQLTGKIDSDLIEFWMGHNIGGVKVAYLNLPIEELRKLYVGVEKYLAITITSRDYFAQERGRGK